MNNSSNIINRYDDTLYENRPVSLNEYINNKYNIIHNELYIDALNKYIHSVVDKYINKNLVYEYYELLSQISANDEESIEFDNIYESIFSNTSNSIYINEMLNDLSIDRKAFFKMFYNLTIDKLNVVKTKLYNFYRDGNYDFVSLIKNITEIGDIKDFRICYELSYIQNEYNETRNVYTLYIDENNELVLENKIIFLDNQDVDYNNFYYYVGLTNPSSSTNFNEPNWMLHNNDVTHYELPSSNNNETEIVYYIAIPSGYDIYRTYLQDTEIYQNGEIIQIHQGDEINQINLMDKSKYTFVNTLSINNILYNIYITSMDIYKYNNLFNDNIKFNKENISTTEINNDFDLICSEGGDYIILTEENNDIRIGYDKNGKWLLIINDNQLADNISSISELKETIEDYMYYESKNLIKEYKNIICDLYKRYHKIIEIKNSEYWMPASINIINKRPPYKMKNVNLSKYWNMIQSFDDVNLSDIKLINENILDSEIIEINYVNGKAKINSRSTDITYEVPFKYLNENTNVSDSIRLSNSFINKYNSI